MATLKYTAYETAFNRHVRNARKAAQAYSGWERAKAIADYFYDTDHPHVTYTFNQMAMNRTSDRQFAIDLLNALAHLTASNEEGYRLDGGKERWHSRGLVGSLNGVSVYLYAVHDECCKQLITVVRDGEITAHATFQNSRAYDRWVESLGENLSGVDLIDAIYKELEGEQQDEL